MHVRELVELAALVSAQAHSVTRSQTAFSPEGLEQYWTASKCRMDRWGLAITKHASRVRDFPTDNEFFWHVRDSRSNCDRLTEIQRGCPLAPQFGYWRLSLESFGQPSVDWMMPKGNVRKSVIGLASMSQLIVAS